MNSLFLVFTAVSGRPSSEESCTGTFAYLGITLNPFALGLRVSLLKFCCIQRDVEMHREAFVLLT